MADYVKELFSLSGRVALVSGASSGIGRHMAATLARAGADVVLVARRADRLAEVDAAISGAGGRAYPLPADLSDRDEVGRVASEGAEPFGAPDILVNAAGMNPRQPTDDVPWDVWDTTLHLNLSVPFFLARALVPGMRGKKGGNIINIASMQSFRAFADGAPYGASKGGVVQLTRAMAEAWSADGIVTNALAPGFFPTELTQSIMDDPKLSAYHAQKTAIGRNGEMTDLDGATIFLASRASAYVTGQVLPVDGGYSAK
ncbi:MAG: SDR family oxidoreductase [Rhodospirillales bacterium]|nr:SDR family oxidoreductase [Rhodospirillales bacterium]